MVSLHSDLFKEPSPSPAKWALEKMGKITSDTSRLPLMPLSEKGQVIMLESMQKSGLLS